MAQQSQPFKTGWFSFELPGYRPCAGTYECYEYESIPPLPEDLFTGQLQWLKAAAQIEEEDEKELAEVRQRLQKLSGQVEALGLSLPEAFLQLIGSPALQRSIPSCTACEFEVLDTIIPYPGNKEGYIIRFLNDQQDVLTWYLYLTPTGEHAVLVAPLCLDRLKDPDYVENPEAWTGEAVFRNTLLCAPSFEAFIFRFWIENMLWFGVESDHPLFPEMERYISRYKPERD